MSREGELHIVTEQGVFGDLDLKDPSKKKVKTRTEAEMAELIREANEANLNR